MSTSKSKNIIIIALLILNIILLATVIFDRTETKREKNAEIAALELVMEQRGISISDEVDFDIAAPASCSIKREEKKDDKMISKLIGSFYREDMGGNVIFYSSDIGQSILRGTGEIDLIFNEDLPGVNSDYAQSVAKYMKRNGVEISKELAEVSLLSDGASVIAPCMLDGYCVYNSKLNFTISGEKLMMINGTRIFDGEVTVRNEELIDSVSAMMLFLDIVRSDGYICSIVKGLEAGYFMNVAVSGECTLRPVWRVSTDTGVIYINAVSGKAENLPS